MTQLQVVGPSDGMMTKDAEGIRADRYLVDSVATGGAIALVEQILERHVLAAPLHIHSREDEFSWVIEGRLGAVLGDQEVFAEAGTLVCKPRGQWHTYWNAGDGQLRILEIITPGGIEELFRKLAEPGGEYDPETLPALAAQYGCDLDFAATMPIAERHQLIF